MYLYGKFEFYAGFRPIKTAKYVKKLQFPARAENTFIYRRENSIKRINRQKGLL